MNPIAAYRVAPNRILVVDEYHGCNYCDTPTGFTIHLFTDEEAASYHMEDITDFAPDKYGHDQRDFALIGEDEMIKAAKQFEKDNGRHRVKFKGDEYENLADFMHDFGLELIQLAFQARPLRKERITG